MSTPGWRLLAAATCAFAAGCAQLPAPAPQGSVPSWADSGWTHYQLPGKAAASYRFVRSEGRDAVSASADSAASMLRRKLRVEPAELGRLRFSWKVPELIALADLGVREKEDSPVRVILAFDGDRSRLSQRDALLSELARSVTGEEMPYATLMYVWCNERAPGSVVQNTRTGRVRKLVLESGSGGLGRWLEYERDIRADYERVFGEKPGALVGIAIMTDSDNTKSRARALYGPVSVIPAGL